MSDDEATRAAAALAGLLGRTVAELAARDARQESLATVKASRRLLLVHTSASLLPAGRAWRLGVLLLGAEGQVWATGTITRATEPKREQHLSASVEERRDARRAASRRFAEGEVVNYGHVPVRTDAEALRSGAAEPLVLVGDAVHVRWGRGPGELRELGAYLADRADLL
ncbi:hypothetical protein ABID92_000112 [Frigoribacterium sp. PvP120]|uniref:hypothetical protein n=1 Tax=Frigoribacterium TaxID=96492 RepID=UPI00141DD32A|nr:hypothetical protein [Frigoribacterium sp. PvP121]MBP1242061.1 hypothetical protein [Frigoribacterium sp. PvP121]NII50920.1 hypothetical protein [Frigoribacterium endophyticum]